MLVGLGNIGNRYTYTRHNIGFRVVDEIAKTMLIPWLPGKGEYFYANGKHENKEIVLLKPSTYMNNCGFAVNDALNHFSIHISNLLIICDDFHLPLGKLRLRRMGSDGGHNGISSVIYHIGDEKFSRLRVGIGDQFAKGNMSDFVLSEFDKIEIEIVENAIQESKKAVFCYLSEGIEIAMSKFN